MQPVKSNSYYKRSVASGSSNGKTRPSPTLLPDGTLVVPINDDGDDLPQINGKYLLNSILITICLSCFN